MSGDPLADELRTLGRALDAPPPDSLVAAVVERVGAEPVPARPSRWDRLRSRWRALVGALTAVVLVGALTPPVRAAVAEWLGIGAVEVRHGHGAPPGAAPPPPTAAGTPLERARAAVAFPVGVPAALGEPASVEVAADLRVVSMSWRGGALRLDQVDGVLAPYFVKTVYGDVVFTTVHGREALWLPSAHEIVVNRAAGEEHRVPPRLAGPTLLWTSGQVTLRLEGAPAMDEAVAIAESGTR